MNIFASHSSPFQAALWLDDKRQNKMLIESVQMLSTALRLATDDSEAVEGLYRISHENHPCSLWVRQNRANFTWLVLHASTMAHAYARRAQRCHKCMVPLYQAARLRNLIPEGDLTAFPNACRSTKLGIDFRDEENTFLAYRKYLVERWKHDKLEPKWTNRAIPEWAHEAIRYRHQT